MRILEIVFLILTLVILMWSLKRYAVKSLAFSIIVGCAFLALILHLMVEGWRWQMGLAYGIGIIVLAGIVAKKLFKHDAYTTQQSLFKKALKIILSGTGIILLLISGILSWAFPVFKLPVPTGPYQVGTSQWYLMDKTREEIYTAKLGDLREISVWGWYPANAPDMTGTAEYLKNPKIVGRAIIESPRVSGMLGITWFHKAGAGILFDYLRFINTHSYPNAPVSPAHSSYPVVVFSHGYGNLPIQNTALMEELASHGYAVFSIGHTYESFVEIFPDGRQVPFSPRVDTNGIFTNICKGAEEINAGDTAASIALFKKYNIRQAYNGSIDVWLADTRFVIDWLEKMNAEDKASPFYRRLDLDKLGVFGMSHGGTVVSQFVFEDRRVKAAINMDGYLPMGNLIDRPMDTPFMFMYSEPSNAFQYTYQTLVEYTMKRANAAVYSITVSGTMHGNFSDFSVYSPILKYTGGMLGKIDGNEMLKIMNAYTLAFFDKYLNGIDSPLLNGPSSDFPEVTLKARM